MITGGDITDQVRRDAVREAAGISEATYDDADLDRKITTWDAVARSYFDVVGATLDGTEPYFQNLITVSNLHTSAAIRQGLGGPENIAAATAQLSLAKSIVAANNKIAPEQAETVVAKTAGISGYEAGTFN